MPRATLISARSRGEVKRSSGSGAGGGGVKGGAVSMERPKGPRTAVDDPGWSAALRRSNRYSLSPADSVVDPS
jgi:hypothetical protein